MPLPNFMPTGVQQPSRTGRVPNMLATTPAYVTVERIFAEGHGNLEALHVTQIRPFGQEPTSQDRTSPEYPCLHSSQPEVQLLLAGWVNLWTGSWSTCAKSAWS